VSSIQTRTFTNGLLFSSDTVFNHGKEGTAVRCEKDAKQGKHRTEVMEATEEGIGKMIEGPLVNMLGPSEKDAKRGKHRTEVTEEGIGRMIEGPLVNMRRSVS
jgi:hypothetical protein